MADPTTLDEPKSAQGGVNGQATQSITARSTQGVGNYARCKYNLLLPVQGVTSNVRMSLE